MLSSALIMYIHIFIKYHECIKVIVSFINGLKSQSSALKILNYLGQRLLGVSYLYYHSRVFG